MLLACHAFSLMEQHAPMKRDPSVFESKKPLLVLEGAFLIFKLLIINQ
jgi:hypothetical protein